MAEQIKTPHGDFNGHIAPPETPEAYNRSHLVNRKEDPSLWLPPQETWQLPDEPIETPTDERGLVDVPRLIEAVKATIDPAYRWPQPRGNKHHFYWPRANYPYEQQWWDRERMYNAGAFCNLPIHKGDLPKEFENWLHLVTLPPAVPNEEVMQYRIEAWRVATDLFKSARQVVIWERRAKKRGPYIEANPEVKKYNDDDDLYAREYMAGILDHHFRGVEQHIAALERVPPEFRLIEPASTPKELAAGLGRFVTKRALKLTRHLQPAANDSLAA